MDSRLIRGPATGALLIAAFLTLPSETLAQRSGVEIWEASCGRCHVIQPTDKYQTKDWRSVGMHMAINARLTSAQREAVIAFLISGARRVDTAHAPPSAVPAGTAKVTCAGTASSSHAGPRDASSPRETGVPECLTSRPSGDDGSR